LDHGNNRVFNQSGTIEQTNHYYPFGMTFGEGIDNSDNRYKYNGKELDHMHGLDLYDYASAVGRWGVMNPLAEEIYNMSPYVYCSNNSICRIDSNGMLDDDYDVFYSQTEDGLVNGTPGKSISVEKGVLKPTNSGSDMDVISIDGNSSGEALHRFLLINTNVEWEIAITGDSNDEISGKLYLGTSHFKDEVIASKMYANIPEEDVLNTFEDSHNHPNNLNKPSDADMIYAGWLANKVDYYVKTFIYTKEQIERGNYICPCSYMRYGIIGSFFKLEN
jgi:RHS repeat-associated protein